MDEPQNLTAATRRKLTIAVFVVAALARILFWQATPDRGWVHSGVYKGDAVTWVEYAAAIRADRPFELGLPIRPPGNAYLLAALGVDGTGDAARGKLVWCLLGALAVAGFFRAALASFPLSVALGVAAWCALSTALLQLSTSLNSETPYLVLVAAQLLLAQHLSKRRAPGDGTAKGKKRARRARPRSALPIGGLLLWGALHGVACLFRVEHVLFFLLATLWLLRRWRRAGKAPLPRLAWAAAAFVAVLVPWHMTAWAAIDRFNHREPELDRAAEAAQQSVERATAALAWTPEARAERDKLPAFTRRSAANFVAATVLVRGGREIDADSFEVLEEAFGYRPEPIAARPFVALYGPLNFLLAHNPDAGAGFRRAALERPPPLRGGIDRYPRALLGGLPPPELAFVYPPHLEIFNHGYRLGLGHILEHPGAFLKRSTERLRIFWQGATLGLTGYGLPTGTGGLRRAVDLAVPTGGLGVAAWRVLLLVLCVAGVWRGRRNPALLIWLLFLATKLAATVLFFGYARQGASCVPVVALLLALAVFTGARLDVRKALLIAAVIAAVGLGLELYRALDPPRQVLDGRTLEKGDPFPLRDHHDRRLELR